MMATGLRQSSSAHTYTTRRVVGAALTCIALVIGASVFGVVGSVIGIMAVSVTVAVVARTLLIVGTIALILIAGYRWSLGGPRILWIASGCLAYLPLPAAWGGRALIGTAFGLTGIAAWLVDALVWVVVVVLVVRSRHEVRDDRIDLSGLR